MRSATWAVTQVWPPSVVTWTEVTGSAAQAAAAGIWAMCDEFWMAEKDGYALTGVGEIASSVAGAPFWALWLD